MTSRIGRPTKPARARKLRNGCAEIRVRLTRAHIIALEKLARARGVRSSEAASWLLSGALDAQKEDGA